MRSFWPDERATTAIVSFAVVIAIYAMAFSALMMVLRQPASESRDGPELDATADAALLDLVGTAGYYYNGTSGVRAKSWHTDPDKVTRFGLAQERDPGLLDLDKMRNLTKGTFDADPANNLLDYAEARTALGLSDYDFHLRTYPLFDALADAGEAAVRNMDVAYIGNFSKASSSGPYNYPVQYTSSVVNNADHVRVDVTITNNGSEDTLFQVEFSAPLDDGYLVDMHNTYLLSMDPDGAGGAVGESQTASFKLYKAGIDWADDDNKKVSVKINDRSRKVADFEVDLAAYTLSGSQDFAAVTADMSKHTYKTTAKPTVYFEAWQDDGSTQNNVDVTMTLYESDGTLLDTEADRTSNGQDRWQIDQLPAGEYYVTIVADDEPTIGSTDYFVVTDTDVSDFVSWGGDDDLVEGPESIYERGLVEYLVEGWVNLTYDNGGDVFPGTKKVMNNQLADALNAGEYDAVIVGSEVDQTALTSNAAKDALYQFVWNGGLLIVLGSLDQQLTWLQPLFHATLTTSGNSIGVPDPNHPILHSPEELDYLNYEDNGKTWVFNTDGDASHFTHVLVREGGTRQEDILALSKPGHFGNGTIVLTAWTAFMLTDVEQDEQALGLLYNFLLQAWGSLYIDLGPRIPDHVEVASAARMATSPSPVYDGEKVLVRVILYVFR